MDLAPAPMANSDDDPGIPKPPSLPAPVGEADDVFAPPPAPLAGPMPTPPVPPLGDLGDDLFSAPVATPAVAPTVPKPVIIPLPTMAGPLIAPTAPASPAKPDSEAAVTDPIDPIDPIQPKSEAAELGAKSDVSEQPTSEPEPEPKPPDATTPGPAKPEPTELAPVDTSSLRAPAHDRKTSTQAHMAVGEFGVFPEEPDETDDGDVESPATPVVGPSAAAGGSGGIGPMLVGLGLVATLVVAFVISNQTPSGEGPPKPNRGEPNEKDAKPTKLAAPEPEPRPRPPTDTTRLVDAEDGDETEGGDVAATTSSTSTTTSTGDETETTGDAGDVDPRDPSVVPPGTPDANVKAFLKLPVSVHDGPPLGGIGATGIHVDAVETGREYAKGQCQNATGRFSLATDTTVSVCFRVVHGRQEETVRVLWDKDGRTSRRASVRIRDIHAYKTAAHLELRPEYVGSWRVRIVGDDDVELASVAFEIAP